MSEAVVVLHLEREAARSRGAACRWPSSPRRWRWPRARGRARSGSRPARCATPGATCRRDAARARPRCWRARRSRRSRSSRSACRRSRPGGERPRASRGTTRPGSGTAAAGCSRVEVLDLERPEVAEVVLAVGEDLHHEGQREREHDLHRDHHARADALVAAVAVAANDEERPRRSWPGCRERRRAPTCCGRPSAGTAPPR